MSEERKCPKCQKVLELVIEGKRKKRWRCPEHGLYRVVVHRPWWDRVLRNPEPKITLGGKLDTSKWRAKCDDCGGVMDYWNLKYCCRKCGNILEV